MPEITVGKWKMRNGEMADVVAIGNQLGQDRDYPVVGWSKDGLFTWTKEGRIIAETEGIHDLIEPWVDPPAPLKLEVGKKYETKGGEVWHALLKVDANPHTGRRCLFQFVCMNIDGDLRYFDEGGEQFGCDCKSGNLIREHVETPPAVTLLEAAKRVRGYWPKNMDLSVSRDFASILRDLDAAIAAEEQKSR